MSKNDPHILGKERIGKLLLQYSILVVNRRVYFFTGGKSFLSGIHQALRLL